MGLTNVVDLVDTLADLTWPSFPAKISAILPSGHSPRWTFFPIPQGRGFGAVLATFAFLEGLVDIPLSIFSKTGPQNIELASIFVYSKDLLS